MRFTRLASYDQFENGMWLYGYYSFVLLLIGWIK